MNILHHRFAGSVFSSLAQAADERKRFSRLLCDRPTGAVVQRRVHSDPLRREYGRRLLQASGIAAALLVASFAFYPEHIPTVGDPPGRPAIVQLSQIPETTQREMRPVSPRPVVPLSVEGEAVPDTVTIESTDLDLESFPPGLVIPGPPGAGRLGPVSDEPMDISEIDYKPHLLTLVMPAFPTEARKEDIKEGAARVKLLVDRAGKVEKVEWVDGLLVFRQEAIETAYRYRFRPGKHQGEVRKVWMVVEIQFRNR